MKTLPVIISSVLMCAVLASSALAATFDQKCSVCHKTDGKPGVSKMPKDALLKKYKTAAEFIAGAKAVKNPMMQPVQNNDALLKDVAAELGLE